MAYKIRGVVRLDNSGNANLGIATATEFDGKVSEKAITEQTDGSVGDVTGADELLLYDTDTGNLLRVSVDEFIGGAGIGTIVSNFDNLDVSGTVIADKISVASTEADAFAVTGTSLLADVGLTGDIITLGSIAGNSGFSTIRDFGSICAADYYGEGSPSAFSSIFVNGAIIPRLNVAYDLGTPSLRFRDLYLEGNTIYLGDKEISSDNLVTQTSGIITAGGFETVGIMTAGSFHGDASALDNISASSLKFGLEYDYSTNTDYTNTPAGFFRSTANNKNFAIHSTDRNSLDQAAFFANLRFGSRYTLYVEYDGGACYLTGQYFGNSGGDVYQFKNGTRRGDLPADGTDCKLMIMGGVGISVRTVDTEVTGITSVTTLSGFGTTAITVISDLHCGVVTCGILTAEYMYGGFIGTIYNTTGNPIFRSEDAAFGGDLYGDVFSNVTSGFSTFHDMNVSGILTASDLDVRQGLGIITCNYIYGGFSGKIYNNTGNPIFNSEDASFGGTVYGDVISGSSGFSTFKELFVAGITTLTDINTVRNINATGIVSATSFHGDGSNLTGIAGADGGVVETDSNTEAGSKYVTFARNDTTGIGQTIYTSAGIRFNSNTGQLTLSGGLYANSTTIDAIYSLSGSGTVLSHTNIRPNSDGAQSLGTNSIRWNEGHFAGNVRSVKFEQDNGPTWTSGTGSPEGVVTAPRGSLYSRTDGGPGTTLYVKESGLSSSNTGWVAK